MNRETELALIDELLALKASKTAYLDEAVTRNPVDHYSSKVRFQCEQANIFRAVPTVAAHMSELEGPGAFLRREVGGLPVLVTRDQSGGVNAFLNVCRHRGTRLVDDTSGCKNRFSCPYHAWTYSNTGELIAAPHFDQGFPEEQKSELGLKRLECQERYGFIWVMPKADSTLDLNTFLEGMAGDLETLEIDEMTIAVEHSQTRSANWKILVEGGIEAYHFRVAHRATIGPYFEDNLSSYRSFGPHLRSILPRTSLAKLSDDTRKTWRLRDHSNILYTLFPTCQLLVQKDHIVWITQEPLGPCETSLRLVTLVPKSTVKKQAHWTQNHTITSKTLDEDFDIAESIQKNLSSGANSEMIFGRFEGALDQFNKGVAGYLNVSGETK
ncbi:MAG: Rieske 2Fe-2S domain-containing protein [Parvibaculaceae bacterium]|nr:Rieske 2Fe-2S domain-containing protein [Parvibaculaceae bacterium]